MTIIIASNFPITSRILSNDIMKQKNSKQFLGRYEIVFNDNIVKRLMTCHILSTVINILTNGVVL